MTHQFKAGDRVATPAGNSGTVKAVQHLSELCEFALIEIDFGATLWIKTEILEPSNAPAPFKAKSKRSRAK